MIAGIVICFVYAVIVWLVFFKFRWLKFSIPWGVVSGFVGVHLLLIFMIGLRFVAPYSSDAGAAGTAASSGGDAGSASGGAGAGG